MPSSRDLPDPGIEPVPSVLAGEFFTAVPPETNTIKVTSRVASVHVICMSRHGLRGLTQLEWHQGWGLQLQGLLAGPAPSCTLSLPPFSTWTSGSFCSDP